MAAVLQMLQRVLPISWGQKAVQALLEELAVMKLAGIAPANVYVSVP